MRSVKRSPVSHAPRRAKNGMMKAPAAGRWRRVALAALLATAVQTTIVRADQREDFLAGRTRECPRCDLAGANFKRRDLTGADLTGANLKDANLHDARLAGGRL